MERGFSLSTSEGRTGLVIVGVRLGGADSSWTSFATSCSREGTEFCAISSLGPASTAIKTPIGVPSRSTVKYYVSEEFLACKSRCFRTHPMP